MAINLPNLGDSILEYDIEQTNEINDKITTFQVLIDGDEGTTVIGGVTYYVKSKVVTFGKTFDKIPNISLTPNTGAINYFGYTGLGRGQVTIHVGRIVNTATSMSIVLISND